MSSLIALILALAGAALVAGVVLSVASIGGPRRALPGALADRVADAERRLVPSDVSPTHGLLCEPERDRRRSSRFERVEQAVAGALGAKGLDELPVEVPASGSRPPVPPTAVPPPQRRGHARHAAGRARAVDGAS